MRLFLNIIFAYVGWPLAVQIVHTLFWGLRDKDTDKRYQYGFFLVILVMVSIFLIPLHQSMDDLGEEYFYLPMALGGLGLSIYHLTIYEKGKNRRFRHKRA